MSQRPRRAVSTCLLLVALLTGLTPFAAAPVASAGTAETMEAEVLRLVNQDRTALGLRRLRGDRRLWDLAGDRAAVMAATNTLSHSVAGHLGTELTNRSIQYFSYGEVIAYTSASWGTTAARSIYAIWKGSPSHWAILMSNRYNYVGVGFAYRSSGARTFGSIVATESVDHTPAWARMTDVWRQSQTVTWTWRGRDILLQTHTAGLRGFDVQYRRSYGTWTTLARNTTARSWTLSSRARGTYHYLRVRARDLRGNTSRWTGALRIWVP